jgi:CheY-like chemotaxis protein
VFAAARDVTERKRFEQALQETNFQLESAKFAAEKANLAKSDFLSSMSHELRSPLNAILGFAQLLESTAPLPSLSQKESITQILQAGWHLLKLINEVLDLAVVESGKVSLSTEPVSLAEVISECQAMMEPQAQQRGISMTFPPLDPGCFVQADRTRVKQVLINLLSNAIKYNREHGAVEVQCAATNPERIRISVKDNGAGLCVEKLAQLFQSFNRLGQEARSEEGTGIGLVVSKRLVELMGGIIGVESTVGVGSVFWIELLLTTAPKFGVASGESAVVVQPQVSAGARQRTLLYVEDNPANMKLVEKLMAQRADLRLLGAINGTLGVEVARASQPEVILMDINLPGISGIEAMKILREDPSTAMPRDIEKGLEAGFFRYLTKPIRVTEFMDTLNGALEFAEKGRTK